MICAKCQNEPVGPLFDKDVGCFVVKCLHCKPTLKITEQGEIKPGVWLQVGVVRHEIARGLTADEAIKEWNLGHRTFIAVQRKVSSDERMNDSEPFRPIQRKRK